VHSLCIRVEKDFCRVQKPVHPSPARCKCLRIPACRMRTCAHMPVSVFCSARLQLGQHPSVSLQTPSCPPCSPPTKPQSFSPSRHRLLQRLVRPGACHSSAARPAQLHRWRRGRGRHWPAVGQGQPEFCEQGAGGRHWVSGSERRPGRPVGVPKANEAGVKCALGPPQLGRCANNVWLHPLFASLPNNICWQQL
jgi:hypothetical protein